jgi:hypothetical protein
LRKPALGLPGSLISVGFIGSAETIAVRKPGCGSFGKGSQHASPMAQAFASTIGVQA